MYPGLVTVKRATRFGGERFGGDGKFVFVGSRTGFEGVEF